MVGKCKGRCDNEGTVYSHKYIQGYKRCSLCVKYIKTDGRYCYCCGYPLRNKARPSRLKEAFIKRI